MENYADNLEDLVAERTGQLIQAKRETEELLYKILPRYAFQMFFVNFFFTTSKRSYWTITYSLKLLENRNA